jgi:FixJ family two-component response regulator
MNVALKSSPIVVVDDDDSVRTGLASLLRSYGWSVRTYSRGMDFLDELASLQPALMIVDVQMPGMNGIQLMGQVIAKRPFTPFIFISAHMSPDLFASSVADDCAGFFSKPVDNGALMELVSQLIDGQAMSED